MGESLEFHGHLDRFSVLGRCVVAEGWANHPDLELRHEGVRLDASVVQVQRPDLDAVFGPGAAEWGFALCAALPVLGPGTFSLRLNAGLTIADPGGRPAGGDGQGYAAMFETFRRMVAERKGGFLEIGSRARSGVSYRGLFDPDIDYVGFDITAGPNVEVVGDAHHLSRHLDRRFGFIFSISVFEHLVMPWKVALEMNKVLEPGGVGMVISHPAWPLHEEPWDFFRFSTNAWRGIFNAHTGFEVLDSQYHTPASIVPVYAGSPDAERMYSARSYLLCGCLVRKVGNAKVQWEEDAAEVFDMRYPHGSSMI